MLLRRLAIAALFLALLMSSTVQAQGVCRVVPGGIGSQDGQSWASAMRLQVALADTNCSELWLRAGRYRPSTSDRTVSFVIRNNLKVYGGFAGTETARSQRRVTENRSVLTGDMALDDVVNSHGATMDANDIVGDNTHRVVIFNGSSSASPIGPGTVLDGVTITGGDTSGASASISGAGIHCIGWGSGGNCSPTLNNLVIAGNRALNRAAGLNLEIRSNGSGSPRLTNITFIGNDDLLDPEFGHGSSAGAIYLNARNGGTGEIVMSSVRFHNNRSFADSGALYIEAGDAADVKVRIDRGHWRDNHSYWNGSVVKVHTYNSSVVDVEITNSLAENNTAGLTAPFVEIYSFAESRASVRFIDSTLIHSLPADDQVMFEVGTHSETAEANLSFRQVTGYFNHVATVIESRRAGRTVVANSILWSDVPGTTPLIDNQDNSVVRIGRSMVRNGCPTGNVELCTLVAGPPALRPLANYGGNLRSRKPHAHSPAIDAGASAYCSATDQRGIARPQGAACDLGAVEFVDDLFADGFQ